jgi:hypothetical protein
VTVLEVVTVSYCSKGQGFFWRDVLTFIVLFMFFSTIVNAEPEAKLIEFWDDREPTSIMQIDHSAWQDILTAYVDDQHPSGVNRFDYASVTPADALKLKNYLSYLQQFEPRQFNSEEAKAFWINLYNAILVDKVFDVYQKGSNRAINRLLRGSLRTTGWSRDWVKVVMQKMSLNDIEHGVLRPIWNDPRVHFAISKGALSSAHIQKTAFNGDNNEVLLEKAKVEFMQHPRAVRLEGSRVILNSVFDWYGIDFGQSKRAVLAYVRGNTSELRSQAMTGLSSTSFEYDWTLNTPDATLEFAVASDQ